MTVEGDSLAELPATTLKGQPVSSLDKIEHNGQSRSPLFPLVPTSQLAQINDAARLANEETNEAGFKGYMSRVFTQVSLPYKDPLKANPDARNWKRRNGGMVLKVEPGEILRSDGSSAYEFPYGKYPRLVLPWITTNIVEQDRLGERNLDGSMTIAIPETTRAFFIDLGLAWGGTPGKDFTAQLKRLFKARFEITETTVTSKNVMERVASFQVVKAFQLSFGKDTGELDQKQSSLWGNQVVISADFVEDLLSCPIPVDLRAMAVLAKSGPLAMDMYSWLNYRLPSAKRSSVVPWELLNWQFGGQYKLVRQFKAQFVKHLTIVQIVYPEARFDVRADGLLIKPSPPATPYKQMTPKRRKRARQ